MCIDVRPVNQVYVTMYQTCLKCEISSLNLCKIPSLYTGSEKMYHYTIVFMDILQ